MQTRGFREARQATAVAQHTLTSRSLIKAHKEPSTYQSARNELWVTSDHGHSAARQTGQSSCVPAACKTLTESLQVSNCSCINKHGRSQSPRCPLPSVPPQEVWRKYGRHRYQEGDAALRTAEGGLAPTTPVSLTRGHCARRFSPAVPKRSREARPDVEKGPAVTRGEAIQSGAGGRATNTRLF